MSELPGKEIRLNIQSYVPFEVARWLDAKANDVFKTRSRFVCDLLVATYNREKVKSESAQS